IHELGHGLAAIITGGRFINFVVNPDGSGLAYTAGGLRFIVIPAGYLSVALFGAGLIILGRSHRWARLALGVIGGGMLLLSLRYGVPSIFSQHMFSGILTTVSGVLLGALFLWVALKTSSSWVIFMIHLVAIQAGLTAFSDLFVVIGLSLGSSRPNDAQSMAQLTFIPAIVWALVWVVIAFALLGWAIWITWLAPSKQITDDELLTPNY
ncbi:MAG: M50 family metallopeptidase, partial [Chloroflexota bacterium]